MKKQLHYFPIHILIFYLIFLSSCSQDELPLRKSETFEQDVINLLESEDISFDLEEDNSIKIPLTNSLRPELLVKLKEVFRKWEMNFDPKAFEFPEISPEARILERACSVLVTLYPDGVVSNCFWSCGGELMGCNWYW